MIYFFGVVLATGKGNDKLLLSEDAEAFPNGNRVADFKSYMER